LAIADVAVGVPEMIPLDVLRLTPAGSAGLTAYELTVPVTVGVSTEIATPTMAVMVGCG
jgi:hypothetical protein